MSVFVNQGPWPWPPGRTQTGHATRRRRRRSFYDDGAWPCQSCSSRALASSGASLAAGPANPARRPGSKGPAQRAGPGPSRPRPAG